VNLRKEARGRECQVRIPGVCNRNPETVVLAHVRMKGITGTGFKAPDLLGAWCCSDCHQYTESRYNDRDTRAFLEGVVRTQDTLIREGKVSW
jgi:hypothetical protein